MALEQGIPHQFCHRFPRQLSAIESFTKYFLTGFWFADVPGHAHMFIDNIGHPGFEVHTGKDTFGGSVTHLYGCHDKIRFIFIFRKHHPRAVDN